MTTLGIIVEYNPFHNGHLYHFKQAKKMTKADTTIAVMSGSFLQRGEPALVDKYTRTKMALEQGIDLVVEIPTVFATQSADLFAFGSTFLLNQLQVDHLVFGSENNSIDILDHIAEVLLNEPVKLKDSIKNNLSLGNSYPKALSLSLRDYFTNSDYQISTPNDILGIQYLQSLKKINSRIKAHSIKRLQAQYHDQQLTDQPIASATAIRKEIFSSSNLKNIESKVPTTTYYLLRDAMDNNRIQSWEHFLQSLLIIVTSKNNAQLQEIHGMVEGFEQRMKRTIPEIKGFSELVHSLKTKRYTSTKVQRTLLYTLLNITNQTIKELELKKGPSYIRVLGFNTKGQQYLNQIKNKLEIPLVTKITREKSAMLDIDMMASTIYELGFRNPSYLISEYKQFPIIHNDKAHISNS